MKKAILLFAFLCVGAVSSSTKVEAQRKPPVFYDIDPQNDGRIYYNFQYVYAHACARSGGNCAATIVVN